MASVFPRLFGKGTIGGLEIRNRVVMLPMSTNFANENGGVTNELIDYYAERAKGGVGLIIVESAGVDFPVGRNGAVKLRCDQVNFVPGLSKLVDAIHQYGTRAVIQIQHAGPSTSMEKTFGHQPVAPSAERDASGRIVARELSVEEIQKIVCEFVKTARYAKAAGFDGVEVHGAHSYLIARFLSPLTNRRGDEYGGSLSGRSRFLLEIVKSIREEVGPDFVILVRINGDEFTEGGLVLQDAKRIAVLLEEAGVDALDISAGLKNHAHGLRMYNPQGWRVYLAKEIKQGVKIPVIASGVIRDPQFAEDALVREEADFIGLGRGLIADPFWPAKACGGNTEKIRHCILCNVGCAGRRISGLRAIRCTVNPDVGQEGKAAGFRDGASKKKVVVIGAGPAGLNAALEAAKRGHDVEVFEKGCKVGGLVRIGSVPFGKEIFRSYINWLRESAKELSLRIRLNEKATFEGVACLRPDAVILATGSGPLIPGNIPGIRNANVITAHDVLAGRIAIKGKKVVVAGGGSVGCETADFLAQANDVCLVEMSGGLAVDMERINRAALLERLEAKRIGIKLDTRLEEVEPRGVKVRDKNSQYEIPADFVVLAMGVVPFLPEWVERLRDTGAECFVVGDAQGPGQLIDAVIQGTAIGRAI